MSSSKSSRAYLDQIFKETESYRCQYIEVLIEKYVLTQDESVEIDLRSLKFCKPKSAKQIPSRPFGTLTSYKCESAMKIAKSWRKEIVSQKRDAVRRFVGAVSSEDEQSANSKQNLKYLTPSKAYQTLLSVQSNELSSDEELNHDYHSISSSDKELNDGYDTLSSDEELDDEHSSISSSDKELNDTVTLSSDEELDDEHSSISSSTAENESTLSENSPTLSSRSAKIVSKKKQNVFTVDKSNKHLTANDKKNSLSVNNFQQSSNFEISNCNENLLKYSNRKQLKIIIENFSSEGNNNCDDKLVYEKIALHCKGIYSIKNQGESGSNSSTLSVSNVKSFYDYGFRKAPPRISFSDIKKGISNKNCKALCDSKSLSYASSKSTALCKISRSKTELGISNKNFKALCDSKSLSYASSKSTALSKISLSKAEMGTSKKNSQALSFCNDKSKSCVSRKSTAPPKISYRGAADIDVLSIKHPASIEALSKTEMCTSKKNDQGLSSYNDKSLPYASRKSTAPSKLSLNKTTIGTHENRDIFSSCNDKSPPCASAKSTAPPKINHCKTEMGASKKNSQDLSSYNDKSLPYATRKSTALSKLSLKKNGVGTHEYRHVFSSSNDKSPPQASTESTTHPKFSRSKTKRNTSNKNCQAKSFCDDKSLPHASRKSSVSEMETPNKNRQALQNSLPLRSASVSSSFNLNVGSPVGIDALLQRKVLSDKKPPKEKLSSTQTKLPFRKCKPRNVLKIDNDYHKNLEEDDLSLNRVTRAKRHFGINIK